MNFTKKAVSLCLLLAVTSGSLTTTATPTTVSGPAPSSSTSSPNPEIQTIPTGEDKIVPLRKGEMAPFDGQFFDNNTALRWGNWLSQYKFRLKLDVDYQKKLGDADVELWKKKYDLEENRYMVVTGDYQKQVAKLENDVAKYKDEALNPPWYRTTTFGFILGVVATGAVIGLGVYTYHSLKP
jgi:hypothetical protein